MISADDANYLSGGVSSKSHPLDRFTQKFVTNLLMKFCVPWLTDCLTKYSESDFHQRMMDPYFDFILDWRVNHPDRYRKFIGGARKLRHRFTYDPEAITQRIMYILQSKAGWMVYDYEVTKLRDTVLRVGEQIYS